MSTLRPIDRRRRAAAPTAARALDVRPPVSEALAATGVAVPASAEPTTIEGLTLDERRVHRVLLDALGLAPAEAAGLEALDAAAIDGGLSRIDQAEELLVACGAWGGALAYGTAVLVALIALGMWAFGETTVALAAGVTALLTVLMGVVSMRAPESRDGERAIYLALRALAADRPAALAPVRT